MEQTQGLSSLVLGFFYDLLGFLLPASLLLVGILALLPDVAYTILRAYERLGGTIEKLVVLGMSTAVLYVVGQLLNFISWLLFQNFLFNRISRLLQRIPSLSKYTLPSPDYVWDRDYAYLTHKEPILGLETWHQFSRAVSAKNIALGSLVFAVVSICVGEQIGLIIGFILFPIFFLEAYIRRVTFFRDLKARVSGLKNED